MTPFTARQKRVLWGCFVAYCTAYIGRLNLSPALAGITSSLAITETQSGLFQTVFAIIYAAGQLINGAIVDRIDERRHIAIGLFGSAACNLLFGIAGSYPLLLGLWALSGAFQSMIWTPIVKIMARRFTADNRVRASFVISITLVAGHFLAWAISGAMVSAFGWRLSFLIPGGIMFLLTPIAILLIGKEETIETDAVMQPKQKEQGTMALRPLFFSTGLGVFLLCCITNGYARDGVMAWGPSMITAAMGSGGSTTLTNLLIPVLNTVGILFGRLCYNKFTGKCRAVIGYLTLAGAAVCAVLSLLANSSALTLALLLGSTCALMYGLNPLITTLVPLEYASVKRVALVAGLTDCFIYVGSSLAGVVTGALIDRGGMSLAYQTWCIACVAGAIFSFLSVKGTKKL